MAAAAAAETPLPADRDAELIEQIQSGSTYAFATLYDFYSARAYRVALSICREDGHAEEAVQEAFMSVWRSSAGYERSRGTVAAWLLSTVRYRAIDILRRQSKHATRLAGKETFAAEAAHGDVVEQTVRRDEASHLRALLTRLPETQREAIALAFYAQLTHTEIAAMLHLPLGTVKGRMRLGMDKLRVDIERN